MSNTILTILQCCDSIRELNEEFQKPWGWLRFKEKREYKKLKDKVISMIDSLLDDRWDIEYLVNLERILLLYWDKLENYIEDISIQRDNTFTQTLNRFIPIYFSDIENNKIYILDIKGNSSIIFNIISLKTGKHLEIVGGGYTNPSQKKVELQCKQKIIDMLKNYLEDISVSEAVAKLNFIKKVQRDIQI